MVVTVTIVMAITMIAIAVIVGLFIAGEVGSWNPTDAQTETIAEVIPVSSPASTPIDLFADGSHIEPVPGAVQPIPENLSDYTVQKLRQIAAEHNVVLLMRDRKSDIIQKLEEARLA